MHVMANFGLDAQGGGVVAAAGGAAGPPQRSPCRAASVTLRSGATTARPGSRP
jgi:hypothetical protein